MSFRQNRGGDRAVALLATCLVVLAGALTCAFVAIVADPQNPGSALATAGGVIVGIVVVLWLLRERPPENRAKSTWQWLARKRKRKFAYKIKPKLPPAQRSEGAPAPPTAASIRQLAGGQSTWVPSATPGFRAPQRRQSET
ncbi:MAG TPA: hypothetical protein VKU82_09215 [Planctomycetaceae bacterium]|nr:hypothetical protein [Planctomycetaceae bacterium]